MAVVLGIDAAWDIETQYGHAFRDHFVFANFATEWPHHLHRLIGAHATQPHVENLLAQYPVHYITAMGHGDHTVFFGHSNLPILIEGRPIPALHDTIIHLLSCKTGASLGRWLVQQGAKAFWGYTVEFGFRHRLPIPNDLAADPVAEVFFRMDCIIDRGILSGKMAAEIYESVARYVMHVMPGLRRRNPAQAAVLLDNYLHLVCPATTWGRVDARLS